MLLLTKHWRERVLERYPWTLEEFKSEVFCILKSISKKKVYYKKKKWENWETIVWFRKHKIIYTQIEWNYLIITYGRRDNKWEFY